MAKHGTCITYTFVNPNSSRAFERELRRILIDKLAALSEGRRQ